MIKEFLKKRFVGRSVGAYIGFAAAILMLVFDIVYVAADGKDRTFSITSFVTALIGSAAYIAYFLLDMRLLDFVPIAVCALFGVALGSHLMSGLETLSDTWNGVNFVGGNATMAVAFIVMFGIGTVAAVVAAFMRDRRQ